MKLKKRCEEPVGSSCGNAKWCQMTDSDYSNGSDVSDSPHVIPRI